MHPAIGHDQATNVGLSRDFGPKIQRSVGDWMIKQQHVTKCCIFDSEQDSEYELLADSLDEIFASFE